MGVRRRRLVEPTPGAGAELPFVSIHLPCRNEPPEVVIATVKSLLALDYPRFEVIVVDNNTADAALYTPVQELCEASGPKVRFFHVDELAGFKAGALNFALSHADERAELIAVVDADYLVDPTWLSVVAPLFEERAVAAVQAPQSYREYEDSRFRTWARDEYVGFFRIGMVQRNEANAIIQHGTMVVLRRSALEEVGRWATWCIVEDAELGLRLLEHGHEVLYLDRELGAGLVPDSFRAFARQRERWAYGAVRIMRAHWRALLGVRRGLRWAQRYHFVGGWLPWIGAALHPVFSCAGVLVALLAVARPESLPALEYAYPLIGFTVLQGTTTVLTYRARVDLGWRRTLATLALGAALTPTISRAVVRGALTAGFPFQVTDKRARAEHRGDRARSWLAASGNAMLALGLWSGAALLVGTSGWNTDTAVWATALVCQSLPSLSASWCHARY